MNRDVLLGRVLRLRKLYLDGKLGGERMPEDANPGLPTESAENCLYFTLPMSLNYQRSSYALWEAAKKTYEDDRTRSVFVPRQVIEMTDEELREKLLQYRVALQPNRHPAIWRRLCETFCEDMDGNVRMLFCRCGSSVEQLRAYFASNKKRLPYLGGEKIMNYWLYVMEQRAGVRFVDRERITVAPDTHVLQASVRLGLISAEEAERSGVRSIAAQRWALLLEGSPYAAIDFHTPMWLWSRTGFAHAEEVIFDE